jgi:hypothetical protein
MNKSSDLDASAASAIEKLNASTSDGSELMDSTLVLSPGDIYYVKNCLKKCDETSSSELKWVKQMKKRIKGLVSNNTAPSSESSSTGATAADSAASNQPALPTNDSHSHSAGNDSFKSKNFGIRLEKCESSSISPVNFNHFALFLLVSFVSKRIFLVYSGRH